MLKLGNIATFTGCTFCWCVQPACPELVTAFHTLHFVMSSFHMQCACFLSQNNDSILWFHHFLSTLLATYPKVMTKWVYDISPFYDIIISYSAHMLLVPKRWLHFKQSIIWCHHFLYSILTTCPKVMFALHTLILWWLTYSPFYYAIISYVAHMLLVPKWILQTSYIQCFLF